MTTATAAVNRQVRLASRPVGLPTRENWSIVDAPMPEPAPGGVLVKTLMLSLDPAMRGWMNEGKSYIEPVGIGEVMRAGGVGRVVASNTPAFAVGDHVSGVLGVQQYCAFDEAGIRKTGLVKIDPSLAPPEKWLNALGMPGMTAYFGLLDVGQPKAGETVVVSGAAGAVGQTVGQVAKIKGCRVVGIAGGADKCAFVVNELGFDACIDYKAGNLRGDLKTATPKGIDCLFENVGGEIFDTLLGRMNPFARIAVCGLIAQYNSAPYPMQNIGSVLINRIKMQGFIVSDDMSRWPPALKELGGLVATGKLKYRETVAEGLAAAPAAFISLLKGGNFGKQLVKLV
jgi:NADPH-dependent curcumin reductase CurA